MGSNKFNNHVYRTQEIDVWVDGEDIGVDFDDLAMYYLHDV